MSKDMENLIDSNERDQNIYTELEKTFKKLQYLINSIKEDEILNLKKIIASQKAQKELEEELSKKRIAELTAELKKSKDIPKRFFDPNLLEKIDLQGEIDWLHEELSNLEEQVYKLQIKVSNLEKENSELKRENEQFFRVDSAKKHYQLDIVDLEEKILNMNEQCSNLRGENEQLNKYCEKLKGDKFIIARLERLIVNLNEKITELEIENLKITGIAPEITYEKEEEIVSIEEELGYSEKFPEIPKGIVSKMLNKRLMKQPRISAPTFNTDSAQATVLLMEEPSISVGRKSCPNCGNTNNRNIREITDKTHLISVYPRIYGKKCRCGDCGFEWH